MPQVAVSGILYEYQDPYADCPSYVEGHTHAMEIAIGSMLNAPFGRGATRADCSECGHTARAVFDAESVTLGIETRP